MRPIVFRPLQALADVSSLSPQTQIRPRSAHTPAPFPAPFLPPAGQPSHPQRGKTCGMKLSRQGGTSRPSLRPCEKSLVN